MMRAQVMMLAAAVVCSGCTATVVTRDGVEHEVLINGGDADRVYVRGWLDEGPYALERDEIVEIDHPTALLVAGSAGVGLGLAVTGLGFYGLSTCDKQGPDLCAMGYGVTIPGVFLAMITAPIALTGGGIYARSSWNASERSDAPARWAPLVAPDGRGGGVVGVMMQW